MELTALGFEVMRLLVDSSIKATLFLSAIGLVTWLPLRHKPAWKSIFWTATFIVLLLIPLLALSKLQLRIPLVPLSKSVLLVEEFLTPQAQSPALVPPAPFIQAAPPAFAATPQNSPAPKAQPSNLAALHSDSHWWVLALVGLYLMGLVWALLHLGTGLWGLSRLRRDARLENNNRRLAHWMAQLEIKQTVQLGISDQIHLPTVLGLRHPLILIPQAMYHYQCNNKQALDHILIHELAHIKRRDSAVHLLSTLVAGLYWFHPLVYLAKRSLMQARELVCDDWALKMTADPPAYASTLLEATARTKPSLAAALGIGMAQSKDITTRIERILTQGRKVDPQVHRLSGLAAILFLLVVGIGTGALHPAYSKQVDRYFASPPQASSMFFLAAEEQVLNHKVSAINSNDSVSVPQPLSLPQGQEALWNLLQNPKTLQVFPPAPLGGFELTRAHTISNKSALGLELTQDNLTLIHNLLNIGNLDIGRFQAILIHDPDNKKNIKGFFNMTSVEYDNANPKGDHFPDAIRNLMRFMREETKINARLEGRSLPLNDPSIFKAPFLYMTGWDASMELQDREKENLGQYLRNGGFLFADDMRPSTTPKGIEAGSVGTSFAQHFKALLQDPLVLGADGAKWKKVPPDHPLYTSFWDLNNGPPLGAAPAGNLHGLEMLELRGRVVALVSHLNLSRFWDNPNTADHLGGLQLGINLIVFALTQHVPSHNIDIDWPRPALNRTPG